MASENEAVTKCNGFGNAAAMREALEFVEHMNDSPYTTYDVLVAVQKARAALSAPPRQCDVGTAEEQAKRMDAYCASYGERIGGGWRCDNCPLCSIDRCELVWAQTPYAAERKGEGDGR